MNKIDFTQSGGQPIFTDVTMQMLQQAYSDGFKAFAKAIGQLNDYIVLSGGIPSSPIGGSYLVVGGYVLIKGEYYQLAATAVPVVPGGALYYRILEQNHPIDPVEFQDGSLKNVHKLRTVLGFHGTPPGAEIGVSYFSADNFVRIPTALQRSIYGVADTWHTVGAPGEPAIASGWGSSLLRFTKREGIARIEGFLNYTGTPPGSVILTTLPAAYWPENVLTFKIQNGWELTLDTDGDLALITGGASYAGNLYINGLINYFTAQ